MTDTGMLSWRPWAFPAARERRSKAGQRDAPVTPAEVDSDGQASPEGMGTAPVTPVVRLLGVSCRRGRRVALHRVSMDVEPGCVAGILGANGAGKSTLLGIITGLYRPFEGSAWVLGERLPSHSAALRRRIGVVLQETALYEELTVEGNLRFTAALYSVPRPGHRIDELLELLGLSDRAGDVVSSLSGGLRRRLTLARALLHKPELLIVDEPTLGVDAEARHAIWEHIHLLRAQGTTVVVASNYLDEVQALCDTAAVLHDGRLVVHESPASLAARAGHCLDIECHADVAGQISDLVMTLPGVSRSQATPSGLTAFLHGDVAAEDVIREVLQHAHISGFRVRAADLAEVFRVLQPSQHAATGP
jgi:ABC-2 type transport system ATP-binding protein